MKQLRRILDDLFTYLLDLLDFVFILSVLMLVFGWVGYIAIEGLTFISAMKKHVLIVTAINSPFDSRLFSGKLFGLVDLVSAWLFLPTLISVIVSRAETIATAWTETKLAVYESAYKTYRQAGKDESVAREQAWKSAEEYVREAKKIMRSPPKVAKKKQANNRHRNLTINPTSRYKPSSRGRIGTLIHPHRRIS